MQTTTGDLTGWLHAWRHGDEQAREQLAAAVYDRLRRMARRSMRMEGPNNTLQPTALVTEAYLELLGADVEFRDRQHFYALAGRMMRRILVDHALARRRKKRGGGARHVPLEQLDRIAIFSNLQTSITELDEALGELEKLDPRKVAALELRYFVGLTTEESADVLEVSLATLHRDLRTAKAWLFKRLTPAEPDSLDNTPAD